MPSFVKDFRAYLETRTDAPPLWHVNAALAALAAALGNRVWTSGRGREIFPNLYVINIGGSGLGKSTSLDMAVRLLQQAGMGTLVLPTSFSWEGFLTNLQAQQPCTGILVVQEYAQFMAMIGKEYNGDAMPALTDFYDVPDQFVRTLVKGPVQLTRPCLTLLGASSPVWFEKSYKESMLTGGYFSRHLFCPQAMTDRVAVVADPGAFDPARERALADHLRLAAHLSGEADFSRVREHIAAHVEQTRQADHLATVPEEFHGMVNRVELLVKKAAMLFHVSENPRDLVITRRDADNAIRYVRRMHELAIGYMHERIAKDPADADVVALLRAVEALGGIDVPRSAAMHRTRLSARHTDLAERTARESGRLTIRQGQTGGKAYTIPAERTAAG